MFHFQRNYVIIYKKEQGGETMKKILLLMMTLLIIPLSSCGKELITLNDTNPIVTIKFNNYDPIVIELYYDVAPNTVRNFISLIEQNYYDGTLFHRVIEDFMIQGGAGSGSACKINGEFNSNGFTNELSHVRGVISMARTSDPNSATSQFFIVHAESPHLNGLYASFGMMIDGFDTLDAIAAVATDTNDRPLKDITIKSITVDLRGMTYSEPNCN